MSNESGQELAIVRQDNAVEPITDRPLDKIKRQDQGAKRVRNTYTKMYVNIYIYKVGIVRIDEFAFVRSMELVLQLYVICLPIFHQAAKKTFKLDVVTIHSHPYRSTCKKPISTTYVFWIDTCSAES